MTPPERDSESPKPILPHGWVELQPLLDALLEADPADRARLLAEIDDPARREALEHLLAECERDVPMLGATAVERFDDLVTEEPTPELSGTLGGRYRIQRELGRGGMARVYLAEDLKHGRDVAVKVIRPELAASLGRDRFLREIGIAARLRHPNIMPLFDSGDVDGLLYFVMPYESGSSLRTRLDAGPVLPLAEILSTLRDVAKALAYAHEQGVVHRDVKPDNVMLSGGSAVVTDFGIAKAVSAARGDAEGTAITRSGVSMGTPAYMAPEQAVGDPSTDHRADIYAFGCLAYELLVGTPPFVGETYQVISAHMRTVPKRISETRPDVPNALSELIQRCLEKDPAARPQQAQALLDALAMPTAAGGVTATGRRTTSVRAAAVIGVAIILAGGAFLYRRTAADAGATAAAARTLVVLPMENRTGDSAQSYLATGLAENIARRLEGIGGIRIRSGARSEWPTATRRDLEMVANTLGSTYLLKTILGKTGDSLDITASVVDINTTAEKPIARRGFTTSTIRDVEGDVAARIAAVIFGAALPADPRPAAKPSDTASYRLTLQGWHTLMLRQPAHARALFQAAVTKDPNNARAWSGLSSAWGMQGTLDAVPRQEAYEQAEAAARHALELDSTQGSAWASLGWIRANRYASLSTGLALIQKGIERDPGNAEVFLLQAALYRSAWRWDDSRDALRFARQLDPISPFYIQVAAMNEMCAGQIGTALVLYETMLTRLPGDSVAQRGRVRALARLGRFDDALAAWRKDAGLARNRALAEKLGAARGASGYWDARNLEGRQRLSKLEEKARTEWVAPRTMMMARFAAGKFETGFRELEAMADGPKEDRHHRLPCIDEFDEVRSSSRFAVIQKRMGPMPP